MSFINVWKLEKARDRFVYRCYGLFGRKPINVYWWSSRKNFGDLMTPALLLKYGYAPVYRKKHHADLLCVGSILDGVSDNFCGKVLGAGLIKDQELRLPNASILAVRGKLTRERLGLGKSVPLGDPGLLADKLVVGSVSKEYSFGLVPHYMDKHNPVVSGLVKAYGDEICLIDAESYPKEVISSIAKCEFILSSSLHGIIAAHSLGIPAIWVKLSNSVVGNGFKFRDYASSVEIELDPVEIDVDVSLSDIRAQAVLPGLDIIKHRKSELDRLFASLADG